MSSHAPTPPSEHAHPGAEQYIRIAIILSAITAGEVAVYYVLGRQILGHDHRGFRQLNCRLEFRAIYLFENLTTYFMEIHCSFPYVVTLRLAQQRTEEFSGLQNCLTRRPSLVNFFQNFIGQGNIPQNGKMRLENPGFSRRNLAG